MTYSVLVALPIADRVASATFYRAVLLLEPFGAPADDGVPEPLQFALNPALNLMLIPSGGFDWVIGDHKVAARGDSECLVSLAMGSAAEVSAVVSRARSAGARVVTEPGQQPWGFVGVFADPDGHLWQVSAA